MATVQVILHGMPGGTMHDTDSYPIILQFNEARSYDDAEWIIPSYPGHIPAYMLSEIRVSQGGLSVVVEGPAGFQSGPHESNWVRSGYPRGKDCAFIKTDADTRKLGGVTVEVVEESLVVSPLSVGGSSTPAAQST